LVEKREVNKGDDSRYRLADDQCCHLVRGEEKRGVCEKRVILIFFYNYLERKKKKKGRREKKRRKSSSHTMRRPLGGEEGTYQDAQMIIVKSITGIGKGGDESRETNHFMTLAMISPPTASKERGKKKGRERKA